MKIFALVVDNEVINIFNLIDSNPYKQRYLDGFSSNPIFINLSKYINVNVGDYYIDNNFYSSDNLETPLEETNVLVDLNDSFISSFAAIANNRVFGIIKISSLSPEHDLVVAGMSSNPECIDASEYSDIEIGWTWNGEIFSPPQGE